MKPNCRLLPKLTFTLLTSLALATLPTRAAELINFPFNEGTGSTVTDTASGLVGTFGTQQDPVADAVVLSDVSPSGSPGDRSITTSGNGFLLADDSATKVLDLTNGPITIECWININSAFFKPAEGIVAYGRSYKMGMINGQQVFTLFSRVDIVNTNGGVVPVDQWVHLAAAWEPGVGVHFYINGVSNFTANITSPVGQPPLHHYLSLASEGFANNVVASLDRVRIHNAVLTAAQLDSIAGTPAPLNANTLVSYNFNETDFPSTNSLTPSLPATPSATLLPSISSPIWTNDTPTGLAGDYAIAFVNQSPAIFESIAVPYGSTVIDLSANGYNYTLQAWIKIPSGLFNERRVIFRSDGPAPRISFSINADRTLHSTIIGTQDFVSNATVPDDNRWHHVAAAVENFERVHFYLDGVLLRTVERVGAGTPSGDTTPARLTIGKESDARYFRGLLDRVRIHDEALTNTTLDFPAIPGLAVFQTQPVSRLVDSGASATFTATVDSPTAATYQWYRRGSLTDPTGVPVAGETAATLTLNNVSLADDGSVYSLFVTNAAGVTESHGARLTVRPPSTVVTTINFEPPTFTSGNIGGQDSPAWVATGNAAGNNVLTSAEITNALELLEIEPAETVQSGSQALFFSAHNVASSTLVRPVIGLENATKVIMDVRIRGLLRGNTTAPLGNMFFAIEGTAGTTGRATYVGPRDTQGAALVQPYFGYGTAVVPGTWGRVGSFDGESWNQFTVFLDYTTKTFDFFVDGVEAAKNVPFVHAAADAFLQLRLSRGANQAGAIVDDVVLSVPQSGAGPEITGIAVNGGNITISWQGGAPPYQLFRRSSLTSGDWEPVGAPTNDTQATDAIGVGPMFYRVGSD